jgi:hypothetical protein
MRIDRKVGVIVASCLLGAALIVACGLAACGLAACGDSKSKPACGNGVKDLGETCDTAITSGTDMCPATCTAPDSCHTSTLQGTACTAQCVVAAITPCCGNGVVETGETCDTAITAGQTGACATSCTAPDTCKTSALTNAGTCTAECVDTAITICNNTDVDSCCPNNCTTSDDQDCALCGNGSLDSGETCDTAINAGQTGACPTSCTPPSATCATSVIQNEGTCKAKCIDTTITTCVNGDGCCPSATCIGSDDDCVGCVDQTGTWISRITTTGTIDEPLGPINGATIDVVQRLYINQVGDNYVAKFEICSLSTTKPALFSVEYSDAVLESLSGTESTPWACYKVNDTVNLPNFTIMSGWGGSVTQNCNDCAITPAPTECCGAIDSDGDDIFGISLPTAIGNCPDCMRLTGYAGLTMNVSLSNMVLQNATTTSGQTSFPSNGYIFGTTYGATGKGELNVTPDPAVVNVTAIKLAGDVPCATVLTHCTGATCIP